MENYSDTFLESFLDSIELLPNDVRRDFELMKELDRDAIEANRELIDAEGYHFQSTSTIE